MSTSVFIGTYSTISEYQKSSVLSFPLESIITYYVYKYCSSDDIKLYVVHNTNKDHEVNIEVKLQNATFFNQRDLPWQIISCIYPAALSGDTVITGLCAVARYICKHRNSKQTSYEHEEGLLGFRKSCLQAPNEVSIWTKFCEVDIVKTVLETITAQNLKEIPLNLVRFENHLNKPVRVHNVYKLARDLDKITVQDKNENLDKQSSEYSKGNENRIPKQRKWKSNANRAPDYNKFTKIKDLPIQHQFAEGPFLTLADVLLIPSYYILFKLLGNCIFEKYLPLTNKWFVNFINIKENKDCLKNTLNSLNIEPLLFIDLTLPSIDDVSMYKCDPKRHNPKKRLFTKPGDIEKALQILTDDLELEMFDNEASESIDWAGIPNGANPAAGHLPDERIIRKSQQLENLALSVTSMAEDRNLIVDFCSGSGHLGILIAYLLPNCKVILLENKEQSLLRARNRVHEMGLKNVYFFQCNLDFFIGTFDIGVALHACGVATDLVLDKCLRANAKFVLCPCCYGSLHVTDRLTYPRSYKFSNIDIDQYLCIGHTADQTHKEHPLSIRGARCMTIIDSDRGRLAEEHGYKVTLSRLKPLSCTPKNNLLIGVPA
ncbi:glutathione S-transferase C-terminal domain-containing protein homolog [Leptidea sinapis]|uniref:glutathione S-transferase C-terminal domain-containing protein homolog n=1 Tax=Leptidea sinapis TaxID=189913 RepID=UPI0021C3CD4D|nr:glutathione S-transferase C-terminal domain-containing protein homolog [Leptidea sinapis]